MIQRIQSIYLLLATILLAVAACQPIGTFYSDGAAHVLNSLGVELPDGYHSTWALLALLILSAIIAFASIFLYKNRVLQMRITVFNSLLIIGYHIALAAFYFTLDDAQLSFRVHFAMALPLIALVFNLLATRGIAKDEILVRAADRLR